MKRDYRTHPRPMHLDLTDGIYQHVRLIDPDFDRFGAPSEDEEIEHLLRQADREPVLA